jgi:hypothetical protein
MYITISMSLPGAPATRRLSSRHRCTVLKPSTRHISYHWTTHKQDSAKSWLCTTPCSSHSLLHRRCRFRIPRMRSTSPARAFCQSVKSQLSDFDMYSWSYARLRYYRLLIHILHKQTRIQCRYSSFLLASEQVIWNAVAICMAAVAVRSTCSESSVLRHTNIRRCLPEGTTCCSPANCGDSSYPALSPVCPSTSRCPAQSLPIPDH